LPNISTGEIAIRNHYHGETAYYSIAKKDESMINQIVRSAFLDTDTQSVVGGWLECEEENKFEADLYITEIEY
jgi:3-oxoacyl-[acyl-carrier-protein] synthase-1